jgi:hypothetical protein
MAGERKFTRIPPASTGNRVTLEPHAILPYDNRTGTFIIDSFVTLATSGIIAHIHSIFPTNSTSGFLGVHYDVTSMFAGITPTAGENIQFDGVTIATVSTAIAAYDLFTNNAILVGKNNPDYGMNVDQFGAATVRFTEGAAQLDAFGKLRTSNATLLGEYTFAASYLPNDFSNTIVGGGAISWDGNQRAAVITTDANSGSLISHTTNTYHHYFPGSSHAFIGTFALDTGVSGLVRNWGMLDDKNGFMFSEKDGVLGITIRSSATGTTVDTFISQSDWNKDKADGTGASGMNLNRNFDNIYWIDIQWLGGGRARFGTYNNGTRVVLHEYYHGNTSPYPITQTASLPVCMVQENTGAIGSNKSMRSWCIAVWSESDVDYDSSGKPDVDTLTRIITGSSPANSLHYLGTLAPQPTLASGDINHSLYFPTKLDVLSHDTTTGAGQVGEVYIYVEPVLSGLEFEEVSPFSTVDIDQSATSFGGGRKILESYFIGEKVVDLTTIFDSLSNGSFKNYAENGGTKTVAVTNITQTSPAVLTISTGSVSQHVHREGQVLTISGVTGMTQINGETFYPKLIGLSTMELYEDEELTTPLNTTGFSAYSSGGTLSGIFGPRVHFSLFYRKLIANSNEVRVDATLNWKEVTQ